MKYPFVSKKISKDIVKIINKNMTILNKEINYFDTFEKQKKINYEKFFNENPELLAQYSIKPILKNEEENKKISIFSTENFFEKNKKSNLFSLKKSNHKKSLSNYNININLYNKNKIKINKSRNKKIPFLNDNYNSSLNFILKTRLNEIDYNKNLTNNEKIYKSFDNINLNNSKSKNNENILNNEKSLNNLLKIGEETLNKTNYLKTMVNNDKYKIKNIRNYYDKINNKVKKHYFDLNMINLLKDKKHPKLNFKKDFNIIEYNKNSKKISFLKDLSSRNVIEQSKMIQNILPIEAYKLRNVVSGELGLNVNYKENEFHLDNIIKKELEYKIPKWVIKTREKFILKKKKLNDLQIKINCKFNQLIKNK